MLGRHRDYFSRKVCDKTRADHVEWRDFPSGEKRTDKQGHILWDREWHHLRFLRKDDPAEIAWDAAWPTHRTGHNWDAIGILRYGTAEEWLLVEAKANIKELSSECAAKDPESIKLIGETLKRTKAALGVAEAHDWMRPYYQFCNRLAALQALNGAGSAARLLVVYFCGDVEDKHRRCPASEAGWTAELAKRDRHVGLPEFHPLKNRVHSLFIDVQCSD